MCAVLSSGMQCRFVVLRFYLLCAGRTWSRFWHSVARRQLLPRVRCGGPDRTCFRRPRRPLRVALMVELAADPAQVARGVHRWNRHAHWPVATTNATRTVLLEMRARLSD